MGGICLSRFELDRCRTTSFLLPIFCHSLGRIGLWTLDLVELQIVQTALATDPTTLTLVLSTQSSLASAMGLIMSLLAMMGTEFEAMVILSVFAVSLSFLLVTRATIQERGEPLTEESTSKKAN